MSLPSTASTTSPGLQAGLRCRLICVEIFQAYPATLGQLDLGANALEAPLHIGVEESGRLRVDEGRVLIAKTLDQPADRVVGHFLALRQIAVELRLEEAPGLQEQLLIQRVVVWGSTLGGGGRGLRRNTLRRHRR